MHPPGGLGVERERELLLPVERVPGSAQRVVTVAGTRAVACKVGGVCRDLIGDYPLPHVFHFRQPEVLLGSDVASSMLAPCQPARAAPIAEVMWS